ncbi:MAG: hypothetical protein ACLPTF_15940 [Steroidobacteraceae bacterium]
MKKGVFGHLAVMFISVTPVLAGTTGAVAEIVHRGAHRFERSAFRAEADAPVFIASQGRLPPERVPILDRGPENCTRTVCIDTN